MSTATHQHRLQLTKVGYNSPKSATTHQRRLHVTNISYNSPTSATTHQRRLHVTNVGYNSPTSATTNQRRLQCRLQLTTVQAKDTVMLCGMISTILRLLHCCSKLGFSVNIKRATYLLEQESAMNNHVILQSHPWAYVQRKP